MPVKEILTVNIDEIKSAIKALTPDERRKVALFILELEKEHIQKTVGPQIAEGLDTASKAFQEAIEKLKKFVGKN